MNPKLILFAAIFNVIIFFSQGCTHHQIYLEETKMQKQSRRDLKEVYRAEEYLKKGGETNARQRKYRQRYD